MRRISITFLKITSLQPLASLSPCSIPLSPSRCNSSFSRCMLHKAQPSEGYWNVPRQGQEPEKRGVFLQNNAICRVFFFFFFGCQQETMKRVNRFEGGSGGTCGRTSVCLCVCVCVRQLGCARNCNLESHIQVVTIISTESLHRVHAVCER